jgi:hypothetical protein
MLTLAGAAAIGLVALPALSASAAPAHAKPRPSHTLTQQPPYKAFPHIHGGVTGTNAGMPPTAQALYAVVNSTGTLARGFGATGAHQLGTGTYEVDFYENVANCAFLGTIGLTGSSLSSPPGEITVVGRSGNANGIFVQTFNSAGTLTNLSYHLGVLC